MKKILYIALFLIQILSVQAHANTSPIDVKIKILDSNTADITLTYTTPFQESVFNVLPSMNEDPTGIYSTYKLISVKTITGESRDFNDFQDNISDAMVYTKPTDTAIRATYRMDNGLQNANLSLFRFPLVLGANYSKEAKITVEYPASFSLLAYPNSEHVKTIPAKNVSTVVRAQNQNFDYYTYDIFILAQKKNGTYVQKNVGTNFVLTSSKTVSSQAVKILQDIQVYNSKYKELLGTSLPNRVVFVVAPVRHKTLQYEVEAVQISKNIILIDQQVFSKKTSDLFRKKVLIHELAHVAISNANLFRSENYNARWFDEGLAVFFEQYISDTFLHKRLSAQKIEKDSFGYRKLTMEEANKEFRNYLDYSVSIENDKQTIANTYRHAGLIFYNLHMRNSQYVPKLIQDLKAIQTAGSCDSCDSENIIQMISNITNLTKDDILYPFDKELQNERDVLKSDPVASKIFLID